MYDFLYPGVFIPGIHIYCETKCHEDSIVVYTGDLIVHTAVIGMIRDAAATDNEGCEYSCEHHVDKHVMRAICVLDM